MKPNKSLLKLQNNYRKDLTLHESVTKHIENENKMKIEKKGKDKA